MKLSDFDIDFIKFKNETHTVSLQIDDTFFSLKENSLYNSGDLEVTTECSKNEGTVTLNYTIRGEVTTQCERCLDEIRIKVDALGTQALRLTTDEELLHEENYLSLHHQVYSIYDDIYETICLNMPVRKLCETSVKNKECELNYSPEANEDDSIDPRWEALKKLIK